MNCNSMILLNEIDKSIGKSGLAKLLHISELKLDKYIERGVTDLELAKVETVIETGKWQVVFYNKKGICDECGAEFDKSNSTRKWCSEVCKKQARTRKDINEHRSTKIKITPHLPYGKSQKLLGKEVIKATKNGTTYGEEKKKRDLEYYESQFVKYADRKVNTNVYRVAR